MQCDWYHPFQALADLLTVIEQKGDPRKLTFNMSYAYASRYQKPISVPQSVVLVDDTLWRQRAPDPATRVQAVP